MCDSRECGVGGHLNAACGIVEGGEWPSGGGAGAERGPDEVPESCSSMQPCVREIRLRLSRQPELETDVTKAQVWQ
ncbi:hypothetical protein ECG_06631 [Echinococcus granulosus]|nr:hypothetical protein ECG_06631 [Echinococcus granulosus]